MDHPLIDESLLWKIWSSLLHEATLTEFSTISHGGKQEQLMNISHRQQQNKKPTKNTFIDY